MKILVYVDAENISAKDFEVFYDDIVRNIGDDSLVGKFYGGMSVLGKSIKRFLERGFEFCETGSFSSYIHKNLADIKIVADCMWDTFNVCAGDVKEVYVLSRDTDFIPLIYKLKSKGITAHSLIPNQLRQQSANSSILQYLRDTGFFPVVAEYVISPVFDVISNAVGNDYTEEAVNDYVSKRTTMLYASMLEENFDITVVKGCNVKEISFELLVDTLGITDAEAAMRLLKIFTQKFYGAALKKDVACEVVERTLGVLKWGA